MVTELIIYNICMGKYYAAIDLKSFYASAECRARQLDPLSTHLVVADPSRTEKTICLAISPSLKSYGLGGRARLFEVIEKVKQINFERQKHAPSHTFTGKSFDANILQAHPEYALNFIIAPPRMQTYLNLSQKIYDIYLQHISPDDIFAYSIDEVFCDITSYLKLRHLTPSTFVTKIIHDIYFATGITATAGIGTNLYLAKIAMDIEAKHCPPNQFGVRIAELNEQSYREKLWDHHPITDFWRIGRGYAKRLREHQIYTMGDVARCSLLDEDLLYRIFGVNAELLIDHAWGIEPTSISDVKNYQPTNKSISSGQVLHEPYDVAKALTIVKEMAEALAFELAEKHYLTNQIVLHINYDRKTLRQTNFSKTQTVIVTDHYGRQVPKPAHGTIRLKTTTNSSFEIRTAAAKLYHRIIKPNFLIRKITIAANNLIPDGSNDQALQQLDFFTQYLDRKPRLHHSRHAETQLQQAILKIRKRYGKNAIMKGTNFESGATMVKRNQQIGGHQA